MVKGLGPPGAPRPAWKLGRCLAGVVSACAVGTGLAAQSAPDSGAAFRLAGRRAEAPPVIDGVIDDAEWEAAAVASGFRQYEPRRGAPPSAPTEVLVLHDDRALYFAFRVFDPETPAAQLTRRDADLLTDDAVVIVLDTYNDRRSAYYFMTNALGTQTDGRITDDGRTVDDTWDASWSVAARRTDAGWTTEIAIPLQSMRYRAGTGRTWGVNFGRSRRRTLELSFWAGPLDNAFRVSQAGTLESLDLPAPTRRQQVIAYGLSRVQEGADETVDGGGDVRFAITPQLSALATVNPDFATIEADQEQINLTRFELSLPEKRPFFLENAELFRQRIRTFYSRRIPDIVGGAQLAGRAGSWTMAAIAARAEAVDLTPAASFGVARLQRDVADRSIVAVTVADRMIDQEHQGSAAVDATLFFSEALGLTAQAVKSWGPTPGGSWAYFVRPAYDSPTRHVHVRYTHLGDALADHANAVGFIRDDDRRELDAAFEQTLWVRNGWLDRLQYDSNYNIYWSQRGFLRSWQVDQDFTVDFSNRVQFVVQHQEEFKRFEADFRNRETKVQLGYNTREFEKVAGSVALGRNFGSDFTLWVIGGGRKITDQTSLEYQLQRLTLRPDPDGESTWIHVVRADQFFTPDLFFRVFFQSNSRIERENVQAVFVYRYKPPFGVIQLAFQRGTAAFGEASDQGNTVFLKATAVF